MKCGKWLMGILVCLIMSVCLHLYPADHAVYASSGGYVESGDFGYEIEDANTINITNYLGTSDTVEIPQYIDGRKVTSVDLCWESSSVNSIKKIVIPDVESVYIDDSNLCLKEAQISSAEEIYFNYSKMLIVKADDFQYKVNETTDTTYVDGKMKKLAFNNWANLQKGKNIQVDGVVSKVTVSECDAKKIILNAVINDLKVYQCTNLQNLKANNVKETVEIEACDALKNVSVNNLKDTFCIESCGSLKSIQANNLVNALQISECKKIKTIQADKLKGDFYISFEESDKWINMESISLAAYEDEVDLFEAHCYVRKANLPKAKSVSVSFGDNEGCAFKATAAKTLYIGGGDFKALKSENVNKLTLLDSSIISLEVPNVITVDLSNCEKIKKINMTKAKNVEIYRCDSLETINLPNATQVFFYDNSKLMEVSLPKVTKIQKQCFENCVRLKKVNIPKVTKIEEKAFLSCVSLANISMPNVTEIGEFAFTHCHKLNKVSVPKLKKIAVNAFSYDTKVEVGTKNSKFKTINGSLYSKNKKSLYHIYSKSRIFTVPNGVIKIYAEPSAYSKYYHVSNCKQRTLIQITIPSSVKRIPLQSIAVKERKIYDEYGGFDSEYTYEDVPMYFDCTWVVDAGSYAHELIAKYASRGVIEDVQFKGYDESIKRQYKYTVSCDSHTYETKTKAATLKKNGKIVKKCSKCGAIKATATIYYPKEITLSKTEYTYNGKKKMPKVVVKDSNGKKIKSSNYTVTYPKGCKKVGIYKVKIKFKGNYSGTVSKTYTIYPKNAVKPKATSITSLVGVDNGFTVKWNLQKSKTTGYVIQYATDKNFTKNVKYVTVNKNKNYVKTIRKLKNNTKYYVRICTYKNYKINGKNVKYVSDWSKSMSVKTK